MFAQETIKPEEVERELKTIQTSQGTTENLVRFVKDAFQANKAVLTGDDPLEVDFSSSPSALRNSLKISLRGKHSLQDEFEFFRARFDLPTGEDEIYLSRSHPVVEELANYILDTALDGSINAAAKRSGAIRTKSVTTRTTLLLIRFRFHIKTIKKEMQKELLAEECRIFAFEGSPKNAFWLLPEKTEFLMDASPDANIAPEISMNFLEEVIENYKNFEHYLEKQAESISEEILDAHKRVRFAAKISGVSYNIEPKLPPDIIGVYVFLPLGGGL